MNGDEDYSVREVNAMFGEIRAGMTRIEAQTTKTNGRVAVLERWQSFLQGGLAILALLVVPIIIYFLTHAM
jgi:hypothetical protein